MVVDDHDGGKEEDDGHVVDEDEDPGEEAEGLDGQQGRQRVAEEGRHGGQRGVQGGAGCPPVRQHTQRVVQAACQTTHTHNV